MWRTDLIAPLVQFFSPPASEDLRRVYVASANYTIARTALLVLVPACAACIVLFPKLAVVLALVVVGLDLMVAVLLRFTKTGRELTGGILAVLSLGVLFFALSWLTGGLVSPSIAGLIIVVLLFSLVHGPWWGILSTGLVVASLFGLAWAQLEGLLPPSAITLTPWLKAIVYVLYFVGLGLLQYVLSRSAQRVQEQVNAEAEGRIAAEHRLANTIKHAPFAAAVCELSEGDNDFVVVHVNSPLRFVAYTDLPDVVGRHLTEVCPALMKGDTGARLVEAALGGPAFDAGIVPYDSPYGERMLEVHVVQAGSRSIAVFISDVTERHKAHAAMKRMVFHDQLTGLANRKTLLDRTKAALANRDRRTDNTALLLIDLDNFKVVNDVHGHAIGDGLLKAVAERIGSAARVEDTVARLGGDEFTVLITGTTGPDDIRVVVERISAAFSKPFEIEGIEIMLTASIGVATASPDEMEADALLDRADRAMYQVKRAGRDGYRFFSIGTVDSSDIGHTFVRP